MKLSILTIGRLKNTAEAVLCDDYLSRFMKNSRKMGITVVDLIELEDKTGQGPEAEEVLLLKAIPENALVIALDERGKEMSSPDFTKLITRHALDGVSHLVFIIGGASGLSQTVKQRANMFLSFGVMVWPHKLVRIMLLEQLYRASAIHIGSPYHRL